MTDERASGGRGQVLDAVVVGSGPNGLAAAITIARTGRRVLVLEGASTPGGGSRSAEVTLPGFLHDVCSAIHPLGATSPFFASARLERYGLEWLHAEVPLAHPLDGGRAAVMHRDLARTGAELGVDGDAYVSLLRPFVRGWSSLAHDVLGPPLRMPRNPLLLARFGVTALQPVTRVVKRFKGAEAGALLVGSASHAMVPLEALQTASFALVLAASGHVDGWPVARGGSGAITEALVGALRAHGGEIECERPVRSMRDLPPARAYLFDVTPGQLASIAREQISGAYRRRLSAFRYGPGVFKLDYALSGAMPWTNEAVRRAGTVHVGGTTEELVQSERDVHEGRHPERPFVVVAQQSVADRTRAPEGQHTLWAYTHVPHGSTVDMTERIERQIDRFAPGWRDLVLERYAMNSVDYECYNPNNVGGNISAGAVDGLQLLFRPRPSLNPYRTAIPGVYLCSASTPPGAGVHGMAGYHAARAALARELR